MIRNDEGFQGMRIEVSLREFDLFSMMENLVLHFYDYRVGGKTIKFEEFITSIVKYVSFLFTRSYIL